MPRTASALGFIQPMKPKLISAPPDGGDWLHEVKFDGYRTELVVDGKSIRAFSSSGLDWAAKYGPIVDSAKALRRCETAIIDGEMCVQDATGVTRFGELRSAIQRTPERLALFAFDLLYLNGKDLRGEALVDRRRQLRDLIGKDPTSRIHFSEHHVGEGATFFKAVELHGLEGIVSKRWDSRYVSGEGRAWLKTKCFAVGDFQVLGVERSSTGIPVALLARKGRTRPMSAMPW